MKGVEDVTRSKKPRTLDDFLGTSYTSNQPPQIITINTNTADLPSKCTRCGTKTKHAGYRKRKKTGETIYRVICTNKQCNTSYTNAQDKTKMIGAALMN